MKKWFVILALIAIILIWKFALSPTKLELTDRVKILQAINYTSQHKQLITEFWKKNGTFPNQDDWNNIEQDIKVDFQNSLVDSIDVGLTGPGVISITYTNSRDNSISSIVNGKKLYLTPRIQGDDINWSCRGDLPPDFLPKPCR